MLVVRGAFLLGMAHLLAGPASANDSRAALGAGGLELTKAADIRMVSEDLYISPEQIRIRYEFLNEGAQDVETLVAFPLPDIVWGQGYESPPAAMTADPVDFVGFEVRLNGQKVAVQAGAVRVREGQGGHRVAARAGYPHPRHPSERHPVVL